MKNDLPRAKCTWCGRDIVLYTSPGWLHELYGQTECYWPDCIGRLAIPEFVISEIP